MATKPLTPYKWAQNAAASDIVDPGEAKRNLGWSRAGAGLNYGEAPPYQWFNFMQNSYGQWIDYLTKSIDEINSAGNRMTSAQLTGITATSPSISVSAASARMYENYGRYTGGTFRYTSKNTTGFSYANGTLTVKRAGTLFISFSQFSSAITYNIDVNGSSSLNMQTASIYTGAGIFNTGGQATLFRRAKSSRQEISAPIIQKGSTETIRAPLFSDFTVNMVLPISTDSTVDPLPLDFYFASHLGVSLLVADSVLASISKPRIYLSSSGGTLTGNVGIALIS